MRRLTVILTAALVAAAAYAQLQWKETAWDFGIIKEADGKVAHRFAYRNGGADTVVVKRTSSSCGCTTARLADTVILPGDSGSLLVSSIRRIARVRSRSMWLCIPTREPHSCR